MSEEASKILSMVHPFKEILREFEIRESSGKRNWIGLGFPDYPDLCRACSGLRKGSLSLVGGLSARGRTSFLLSMAISVIKENKIPVLFISYEKPPKEMLIRLLSRESGLDMTALQTLKIMGDANRKAKLKTGMDKMAKYQGYLHLLGGGQYDTAEQIEAYLYQMREQYKVKNLVLIVDTMQRIPCVSFLPDARLRFEDSLGRLKGIALSMDISVLAGSDISEYGEEIDLQDNKDRVTPAHFYGSPVLGRFADFVYSMSKNWLDTQELKNQLKKKAQILRKQDTYLPDMDVVDVYLDKLEGMEKLQDAVQFLVYNQNGFCVELGFKAEQEIQRYNNIDRVLSGLCDQGLVEFHEEDPFAKKEGAVQGAAGANPVVKPKVSLKLG